MHKTVLLVMLCGVLGIANAATIIADPDSFTAGTNLKNAFAGVTLTAVDASFNYLSDVISVQGSYKSTGVRSFGHASAEYWYSSAYSMKAVFAAGASSVSLDFIGDDSGDPSIMKIYNVSGTLLATLNTNGTLGSGVVETLTYNRVQGDISYIIASGNGGETVWIDNLRFTTEIVPEPTSLSLLALAICGILLYRKK